MSFIIYRDSILIKPKFSPPAYEMTEMCLTVMGATFVTFTVTGPYGEDLDTQRVCSIKHN